MREEGGHYKIADKLRPELERRGVRLSRETIANKVRDARQIISPQGPIA
jgi:hypothetical protein